MRRATVGAEERRMSRLASGGALLPGTVNLWLRWPKAGMLRTASHSASEAAERTVRPWTLDSSQRAGQIKKGEHNLLCSNSPSLFFLSSFSSLSFSPVSHFCSQASFSLMFQFFPTPILSISPCFPKFPPFPLKPQLWFFSCDLHPLPHSSWGSAPLRLRSFF